MSPLSLVVTWGFFTLSPDPFLTRQDPFSSNQNLFHWYSTPFWQTGPFFIFHWYTALFIVQPGSLSTMPRLNDWLLVLFIKSGCDTQWVRALICPVLLHFIVVHNESTQKTPLSKPCSISKPGQLVEVAQRNSTSANEELRVERHPTGYTAALNWAKQGMTAVASSPSTQMSILQLQSTPGMGSTLGKEQNTQSKDVPLAS